VDTPASSTAGLRGKMRVFGHASVNSGCVGEGGRLAAVVGWGLRRMAVVSAEGGEGGGGGA